jgi:hypothetical protein
MILKAIDGTEFQVSEEDAELILKHEWKVSCEDHRKYIITRLKPRIRLHRLITSAKPGEIVDHINGNCLDNRRENLRICTDAQNQCNRGMTARNTVGFKGVTYRKDRNKYAAQIQKGYKNHHLGTFDSPTDAAHAYDKAAKELHGEFARTNF